MKTNRDVMIRIVKPCTFSLVKMAVKDCLVELGLGTIPPTAETVKDQEKRETDLTNPETVEKLVLALLSANGYGKLYCEVADEEEYMALYLRK